MTLKRAYSFLEVKSVSETDEERIIEGIATTPTADRVGDIVEPMGAKFKLPMPLLWQHRHDSPVGFVEFAKPTAKGIPFKARIVKISEAGTLQDRVNEAWQSVKAGLVRAVSIGFSSSDAEVMSNGGLRFKEWEWLELSLVTIPANAEATIQTIKSIDTEVRAATGAQGKPASKVVKVSLAGDTAQPSTQSTKGKATMTLQEQLKAMREKRAQNSTELQKMLEKSAETGETFDAEQSETFDNLESEVKSLDEQIARIERASALNQETATPVEGKSQASASASRGAPAVVRNLKNEEPGIGFARFAMSMYAGRGDVSSAKAFAEHAFANDTRLQGVMKAAVAAGTTTSPTWAGNLVDYQNLSAEFLDFLRPRTVIGQLGQGGVPGLRQVPFNVRIPGKTSAGRAQWVGEGYRKPVTSSGYEATELKWAKIAAISVITEELARFSDPSIQVLVRDDLSDAVIERMDEDFVDPAKAAGTGASLSPASITNGVTPIVSSGDIYADIAALWATADATNLPVGSAVYITDSKTARALSTVRNSMDARAFPDVSMNGGSIDGVPVVVSNYVPSDTAGSIFILAFTSEIYLADDGVVNIDVSREATIVMDDDATATPTIAQIQSMFQTNQLAIRAERYVNWKKRRPQAVAYLSGVNWTPSAA